MYHIYSAYYGYIGRIKASNRKNALILYKKYAMNDSILKTMDMGGIYAMHVVG